MTTSAIGVILLVEDYEATRGILETALSGAGHTVHSTGSGARAAMPDSDRKGWVPVEAVAEAIAVLAREASAHITGTLLAI